MRHNLRRVMTFPLPAQTILAQSPLARLPLPESSPGDHPIQHEGPIRSISCGQTADC